MEKSIIMTRQQYILPPKNVNLSKGAIFPHHKFNEENMTFAFK
jgi:hypothetical protein